MEFRCDINGKWHFFPNCPKWPTSSLSIVHSENLPYAFEVCGRCRMLKEKSMGRGGMIPFSHRIYRVLTNHRLRPF